MSDLGVSCPRKNYFQFSFIRRKKLPPRNELDPNNAKTLLPKNTKKEGGFLIQNTGDVASGFV